LLTKRRPVFPPAAGALFVLFASDAYAQGNETVGRRAEDIEHTIIVGAGAAAEVELADGALHPGANVMVEWDAIESWLEIEVEASVLSAEGGVEVPVGLLFKKPFRLTPRAEFMVGVGPEVVRVSNPTTRSTYAGAQLALDFMFWPWQRAGFWVEPSYDLVFGDGPRHGVGSTGGVLLGW
jgi:hypothetical protein